MKKNITIRSNELEISQKIRKIIIEKFEKAGFTTSEEFHENTALVISIGGDGSFLRAARELDFPDVPFFCINTGHLGFFAEILPDEKEIDYFIKSFIQEDYAVSLLPLLEVDIANEVHSEREYAINELVVRGNRSRTAHLQMFVNGNYMETFSGDGLIISTSTGSTAYNYSAGGSIVDNRLEIMQITPISPISTNAFRSFTSSIILPAFDSEITVKPEWRFDNMILLVIDGEEKRYQNITAIKTRQADKKLKLLRLDDYEFWNRVYMKFLKTYDYKENERRNNL